MPDPKQTKPKEKTKREKKVVIENTDLKGLIIEDSKTAKEIMKDLQKSKKQLEQNYQEQKGLIEYEEQKIRNEFETKKDKIVVRDNNFFYKFKKGNKDAIYNLSHSSRELFLLLMINMDYMDNVIYINGKYPSNEDLQTLFNMSYPTLQKALKELKDNRLIHVKQKKLYRVITLNPYIIEDTKTSESTWDLFKNYLRV